MRLPYPERITLKHASYFALALFMIQALEGTFIYFCVGTSLFILIATLTFNAAGGLNRASGAYVFFYSMLVVIVGLCYKAYLGEPAQMNLNDPLTDIEAYVGSITAMYAAVVASRRFSRKTGFLEGVLREPDMYRASVGCMLFGALGSFGIALLGKSASQLQTAFAQLNLLIPVGIIIGIMYEIRRSGGTRCMNLAVILGTAYVLLLGATGFSKAGLIAPLFCWVLPIWALRYRLSVVQVLGGLMAVFIIFYYLVPFAQYGRNQVDPTFTFGDRIAVAARLLEHPDETRSAYLQSEDEAAYLGIKGLNSYYNKPEGLWERLQFVSVDDVLNNFTDQGHVFGLLPVEYGFINIVPHFLWPNKPGGNLGSMYAHELTGTAQGEGDVTTGISFSPTGEAYHLAKWAGIFVIAPILWFMFFTIYDFMLGDVRSTPWGLVALLVISHSAPESGIVGTIYLSSTTIESLIFCAFFAAWFAPLLAIFVLGPDRSRPSNRLSLQAAISQHTP